MFDLIAIDFLSHFILFSLIIFSYFTFSLIILSYFVTFS